ncbi:hypothetical protein BIW11_07959 [Tropilaelaps mercedesae]|uniref:Uncharacterized protein n=1 Tax=Tropilaelaps mercedesae TaxID=418985 RepID=A0A1V9XRM8_9ACAR|nr:hypothetical protein BIW11_07959 [Tropilaelaps mercedesae]
MIMDLFLAGIDTTAYSVIYLLYHLATHPACQERLREELRHVQSRLGPRPPIQALDKCTYLRACTRESHRLLPVALGTGRILDTDVTLSGYNVPAGVMMLLHNQASSRDPSQFANPDEFHPERWLRSRTSKKETNKMGVLMDQNDGDCLISQGSRHHPFSYLPFGYGPRMCIGRRFAEGVINILTFKIIANYSIKYTHNKAMDCFTRLINVPDQPLKIAFEKIES